MKITEIFDIAAKIRNAQDKLESGHYSGEDEAIAQEYVYISIDKIAPEMEFKLRAIQGLMPEIKDLLDSPREISLAKAERIDKLLKQLEVWENE